MDYDDIHTLRQSKTGEGSVVYISAQRRRGIFEPSKSRVLALEIGPRRKRETDARKKSEVTFLANYEHSISKKEIRPINTQ